MQFLRPGDRIRLIDMPDDLEPIPSGSLGTVVLVRQHGAGQNAWYQVDIEWDIGRKLMLSIPPDLIEVLPRDRKE
jgi:hypothetical protein